MNHQPDWLPQLILFDGADLTAYEQKLYDCFCDDYLASPLVVGKTRVALERNPLRNGRHRTFWHLTTEGRDEVHCKLCIPKCERIRWPKAILVRRSLEELPTWRNKRGTRENLLIALPDFSYAVVLALRKGYYYLWTAYCIIYERQRSQHKLEWQAYKNSRDAINKNA